MCRWLTFPFVTAALALAVSSAAVSSEQTRTVEVNGVTLPYVDQGEGNPVVFVPATIADHRVWEPYREAIAREHRFISYTKRYFGTEPWPDDGEQFSSETHAADLAAFIRALDAGPVYLVSWSYSGQIVPLMALEHPELVRGMVHYEPHVPSLVAEMPEEIQAAIAEDNNKYGPAMEALEAGDAEQATKLFIEAVFQRSPGGFEQEPEYMRVIWLDNARTVPLQVAMTPPAISCEDLATLEQPTLILRGEHSDVYYASVADTMAQCQPQAELGVIPGVNHDGTFNAVEDFTAAILDFLAEH
ncbi:alpha/beta fold hydrolase [Halomonas heilongjiangensis]|uniref:Alpha/beta hydrolase n=1 Tax=Halomonas heilongjiangensis TaxID=1387883 RepID=A0A2N7TRR9_9GAMM|nr:alpha/beta hydrolase [Halomonas heilongjiangensis]PMR70818.1 alpha/beta hydrolase [Halomonas heilongjiangensis]PXX94037.1 alpha/beta hydrolase [Halomonas heilongjiangensis]